MTDFSKYAKHLLKKIKVLSGKVMDDPSEIAIHSFRVEVKKLNALIQLLTWHFPELDKKKFKKLRKLFKSAGVIREWQLLAAQIRDSAIDKKESEGLQKLIHHEEKKAYRKFRVNHEKLGAEYMNEISNYLHEFVGKRYKISADGYVKYLQENIQSKWKQKNLTNGLYHELRRDIKELKYNLKVSNDDARSSFRFFAKPEFLDECEELLGKWHDGVIVTGQLQSLNAKDGLTEKAKKDITSLQKSKKQEAGKWLSKFKKLEYEIK